MTTPCELVQIEYQGDGSQVIFPFPFPYEFKTEVKVAIWNNTQKRYIDVLTNDATYPWEVSDANPTAVTFTSTAPPTPPTPGVNEDPIFNVRVYRVTDITDIRALFNQGSGIRATDLNRNFDQLRSAIQEGKCQVSDKVFEYLEEYYWNKFDETIYSTANGGTWVSNDQNIPSTAAADERFVDHVNNETIGGVKTFSSSPVVPTPSGGTDAANKTYVDTEINDKIDAAITNDIGTDGTGITVTDDGDGTITLGLADDSIDFDKIKGVDIITEAEQDAGSPAPADNNIFTGLASSKRFDTIVSDSTPVGSDWEVGKTWLQPVPDNTLSIWNGSSWVGVASGGTFLTQPTVIYVDSVNGNDAFDGHRIINPKKTIKNAVASANAGDIVYVVPGVYEESLPIDITVSNLSIVGQSIRSCFIHPTSATETETMFRCNSGTYITGFTFAGLKASGTRGGHPVDNDPTYGLPTNQGWVAAFYPGCIVKKSPYIQNCTNFADSGIDNDNFDPNNFAGTGGDLTSAPTGGGIFVDGSVPSTSSPLRSFVVDSFTQICLDGPGCLVANNGYAQLVSFFGTFCHYHTKALSGGQVNLTNSTTDFGRYGLIADGKSTSPIFTATANGAASAGDITFAINQPTDLWFGSATRPLDNMVVVIGSDLYPILSSSPNGLGWNVTISNPNPSNRAENLGLTNPHSNGTTINFYLRSLCSTSGHTFEYAGSGTDYTALPENGGVADELKQTVNLNDGRVWQSSTDQNGKFKVGDTFEVDQKTGFVTIDPQSYSTNLVSDLSPQLGGDLDVLGRRIFNSTGNVYINDPVEVNLGSAASPSVTFNGDTNTGIYSPGADQLALSTNGSERARIDSSGRLLVGTSTARSVGGTTGNVQIEGTDVNTSRLSVTRNSNDNSNASLVLCKSRGTAIGSSAILQADDSIGRLIFAGADGNDIDTQAAYIECRVDGTPGANDMPGRLVFATTADGSASPTERLRIDSSGRLLVGTSSARSNIGAFGPGANALNLQHEGTSASTGLAMIRNSADTGSAYLILGKTRGTAVGQNTVAANGDNAGVVSFVAADGTNLLPVAVIQAVVDGTPGTDDMPGRLVFSTTADGASSPTEQLRITSDRYVRLASGTGGIQFNGDTAAANALDDYEEGTFTPTIAGSSTAGTGTYAIITARYIKIGKLVYIMATLNWTAHTGTGNMFISGLPFIIRNINSYAPPFASAGNTLSLPASSTLVLQGNPAASTISVRYSPVGGGTTADVPMDTSAVLSVAGCYETD